MKNNYIEKEINKKIEEGLLRAEEDIKNGRVKSADEVFNMWKLKYGI